MIRALLLAVVLLGCLGCEEKKKPAEAEPAPLKIEPQDTAPAVARDTAVADTHVEDTAVVDTDPAPPPGKPKKKLNIKPPIISN